MIGQEFLEISATEYGISDNELEVLKWAMKGSSTREIAQKLNISQDAVRKRLSEIYRKFNVPGSGPVKLAKLQHLLLSRYQSHLNQTDSQSNLDHSDLEESDNRLDQMWNGAPDVSIFYGRTQELATLEQSIVKDKCRLIAVLGMGGIGKTSLSVKIARQIQGQFEYVIWRSLQHKPSIGEFVADLIKNLSYPQTTNLPSALNQQVQVLIEYLSNHRCLLVIDAVETILDRDAKLWRYGQEYNSYGLLFRQIGEEKHQSCLILNSIEKPQEVALLESPNGVVRSLELQGLDISASEKILHDKGLVKQQSWHDLIGLYRGNPLALKLVATTIKEVFSGNVAQFLQYEPVVVHDMFREILDWQFKRLSKSEIEIISYLAQQKKPISVQNLQEAIANSMAMSDIIKGLESLGRLSLLEKVKGKNFNETFFSLQPVVKSYINKYLSSMS